VRRYHLDLAGGAGQIGTQNPDGRSHLAGARLCPPLGVILKNRAAVVGHAKTGVGPAAGRCAVQVPIRGLDQGRRGVLAVPALRAKAVERRQIPGRGAGLRNSLRKPSAVPKP
jgi:hypothetical protein